MCVVGCFTSVYIFVPRVCLEPLEARRGPRTGVTDVVSSPLGIELCSSNRHPDLLSHLSSPALFCETRSCFLSQVGLKRSQFFYLGLFRHTTPAIVFFILPAKC